jgi:soluble lytic murein transglycosylase-like protein
VIRTCVRSLPFFVALVLALGVREARAEIVYFSTGRTLSIKDHRADEDKLVLSLRAGGEIICDPALIDRIVPDEVPYPEPETEKPAAAVVVAQAPAAPVKYGDIIEKVSAEQDVPVKLVRAVIQVESAYHERARSPKGAMGLMQLMPATAKQYAVADPYDPASNIEAGVKHLKSLLQRLPVALALAAYNAGEAAVQRFNGIPPYRETQDYVSRILNLASR